MSSTLVEADRLKAAATVEDRVNPMPFSSRWLIFPESKKRLRFKVRDWSSETLRGQLDCFLAPGHFVWMVSGGKLHWLEVVWCHLDFDNQGSFQAGFRRR